MFTGGPIKSTEFDKLVFIKITLPKSELTLYLSFGSFFISNSSEITLWAFIIAAPQSKQFVIPSSEELIVGK